MSAKADPNPARKTRERVLNQEEAVAKSKAKYDAQVGKLKNLYTKRDEIKKKELIEYFALWIPSIHS